MNDTTESVATAPEAVKPKPVKSFNGYTIRVGDAATTVHADHPIMTVEFVDDRTGLASCVWFDVHFQAQRFNFIGRTLTVKR